MNVSLPTAKYTKPEQQTAFFDEVLRRVSALPGVRDAAISAALPLSWKRVTPLLPDGQPNVPLAQRPFIDIEAISPAVVSDDARTDAGRAWIYRCRRCARSQGSDRE
jgi:hypothetical protein